MSTRDDVINHSLADQLDTSRYPAWLWDRLEWFQDLKFGLFMHWGPYCQWGCIESWPLVEEDTWARPDDLACWAARDRDLERFRRDYFALNQTFNPTAFDPAPWVDAAAYAGMTYMSFTTKHHDGFCMFDTGTTDYRVTHPSCPFHDHPRANITKVIFDAFRERQFAISCYFSKSDWHCPWYWRKDRPAPDRNPNYDTHAEPEVWQQFIDFVHAQVEELMTGYGPLDALWLDGGQVRPPRQDIKMDEMVAMARRHQPGLILADRTVGGFHENILTPEQEVPDAPMGHAWESCMTMGNGWSYRPDDEYKPAGRLIRTLVDIVAKGGNLLLNIGPSPAGEFAPEALRRLRQIGDWMQINGDAIHGTRPIAPYVDARIRFTSKAGLINAIYCAEAEDEAPPRQIALGALQPAAGSEVRLLGHASPLSWSRHGDSVVVELPPAVSGRHAWTLQFTS